MSDRRKDITEQIFPHAKDPSLWREFHGKFMELEVAQKPVRSTQECLDAYWAKLDLSDGPDEHLKAKFEALATAAGKMLGCLKDMQPLEFWLRSLFMDLRKIGSRHLLASGQVIHNVCEASALFCLRLEKQVLEQTAELSTPQDSPGQNNAQKVQSVGSEPTNAAQVAAVVAPKSWQEIEITFTSEHRVDICSSGKRESRNFSDLGFEDHRSGKPNGAWVTLCEMAKHNGTMPVLPAKVGKDLAKVQKRIEEIREKLRSHFKIEGDPIPFNSNMYQASFKVTRGPSFDT